MLMTKNLQKIDRNPAYFKGWACKFDRVKSPCYCKNNEPVGRYVCYKFHS